MTWVAALLVPAAVALVVVWRATAVKSERLAAAPAAAGIALGLASVVWAALFFSGIRSGVLLTLLDLAAWAAMLVAGLIMTRGPRRVAAPVILPADSGSHGAGGRADRAATAAAVLLLAAVAAIAVASFASSSAVFPHGEWDAWAQWNLRARFFFRGLGDGSWREAFAPILAWSHADYPPLVPVSVARLWAYGGGETVAAPIALAAVLAACTVLTAGLSAARERGAARGCLAAAVVLACPSFVRYAASQCADIALGFFMLAAFVAWSLAGQNRRWLALAGLSAALAAWTKNEGLAFFAVFIAVVTIERLWSAGWSGLEDLARVLAGAAPVLILVVVFKQAFAPPSYFVAEQSFGQAMARLLDAGRARFVATAMARELWFSGATVVGVIPFLAAFAVVRGVRAPAPAAARAALPAMAVMAAIYGLAYLVTPKDLVWQLNTSLDRVVVQLVPTMAWSVMAISRRGVSKK
jgi:hypothetical protein